MNETEHAPHQDRPRLPLHWKLAGLSMLAVATIAGFAVYDSGQSGTAKADASAKPIPVVTGIVTTRDMPIWISGIGSVAPLKVVDVKARVDGQIMRLAFNEGDEVQAGRLLAQIDPRPYQAVLAQAQAARARDMAQLVNARQEVSRTGALSQAGAGTTQSYDAAKAQAAALQATVAADDAAIAAARLNVEFAGIVAPIAGRVGLRQVNQGSMVHASDTTGVVTVTQMAPISVLFTLPQDSLGEVLTGQRSGALPVSVYSRDGASHIVDGRLLFVGSNVDQTNGQFQLRAEFGNGDRALWPGEFVSARVLVRTDRGVAVVPNQAVQTSETGRYVYAVKSDGTAEVRNVKAGPAVDGFTEILSGLKPGEKIVVSGQSRLSAGAPVKAQSSAQSAAEQAQ